MSVVENSAQNGHDEPRAARSGDLSACDWCGRGFRPYRSWSRFCCHSCKREWERAQLKVGRKQLELFGGVQPAAEPPPVPARRSDPATSHAAAAEMTDGGHCHDDRCLDALRRLGLATYREVAEEAGLEPIQAQRALTRLSYRGGVQQTRQTRACRTNGRRMQLWEVVR